MIDDHGQQYVCCWTVQGRILCKKFNFNYLPANISQNQLVWQAMTVIW